VSNVVVKYQIESTDHADPPMTTNLTLEYANNFSVASNLFIPQLASRSSYFQGEFEGLVHGICSFCGGLLQRAKIQGQIKAVLLGCFNLASGRRILDQLPQRFMFFICHQSLVSCSSFYLSFGDGRWRQSAKYTRTQSVTFAHTGVILYLVKNHFLRLE
jgi:hypothetical protein